MRTSWADKNFFKNRRFEVSSSLIPCNNNRSFLNWIVMCNEKWILYNWWWKTQLLDWEAPKYFPNLHQTKVTVTVWWSATGLIRYSFLNPGGTITSEKYAQQTNEMHWKPTPPASFGQHKEPNSSSQQCLTSLHTTSASKDEQIGFYLSL